MPRTQYHLCISITQDILQGWTHVCIGYIWKASLHGYSWGAEEKGSVHRGKKWIIDLERGPDQSGVTGCCEQERQRTFWSEMDFYSNPSSITSVTNHPPQWPLVGIKHRNGVSVGSGAPCSSTHGEKGGTVAIMVSSNSTVIVTENILVIRTLSGRWRILSINYVMKGFQELLR